MARSRPTLVALLLLGCVILASAEPVDPIGDDSTTTIVMPGGTSVGTPGRTGSDLPPESKPTVRSFLDIDYILRWTRACMHIVFLVNWSSSDSRSSLAMLASLKSPPDQYPRARYS